MTPLLVFLAFLIVFALLSGYIVFRIMAFRTSGDASGPVLAAYALLSVAVILLTVLAVVS